MRLKINRAILGYVMAGIVMLGVFLYFRFPGESVTDYVKAGAAAARRRTPARAGA